MPEPALIYQQLKLRSSDNRVFNYGCMIDRNATVADFLDLLAKKHGLRIEKQYYEKYGSSLIVSISGKDKTGRTFELTDIQLYVDNKFVHLRAEDGTSGWANAELLKVGDLRGRNVVMQSDSALGNEFLAQDLPSVPVLERNDALLRRISGGGASEPSMDADRSDLENLRNSATVPILVEVADKSFKTTTMDGQEINDSNLLTFLNREFGFEIPQLPKQAEQTLLYYLDRAIREVVSGQNQQLDGTNRSVEIQLKLIATRFDAIERYQLYVSPPSPTAENPQTAAVLTTAGFSFEFKETPMIAPQAQREIERAIASLERMGIRKIEENPPAYKEEESMIVRMIMNPTERKLWGKLYGFPDEEVSQPVNDPKIKGMMLNQPQLTDQITVEPRKEPAPVQLTLPQLQTPVQEILKQENRMGQEQPKDADKKKKRRKIKTRNRALPTGTEEIRVRELPVETKKFQVGEKKELPTTTNEVKEKKRKTRKKPETKSEIEPSKTKHISNKIKNPKAEKQVPIIVKPVEEKVKLQKPRKEKKVEDQKIKPLTAKKERKKERVKKPEVMKLVEEKKELKIKRQTERKAVETRVETKKLKTRKERKKEKIGVRNQVVNPTVNKTRKQRGKKEIEKPVKPKFAEKKNYGVKTTVAAATKVPKARKTKKQSTPVIPNEKIAERTRPTTKSKARKPSAVKEMLTTLTNVIPTIRNKTKKVKITSATQKNTEIGTDRVNKRVQRIPAKKRRKKGISSNLLAFIIGKKKKRRKTR